MDTHNPDFNPNPSTGNLSLKGIDATNTAYTMSYERTPVPDLPFPHPKWHIKHSGAGVGVGGGAREQIYEVTSPIYEEYDTDSETWYLGSVGGIRQSVEIEVGLSTGTEEDYVPRGRKRQRGMERERERQRERERITRVTDIRDRHAYAYDYDYDGWTWMRNWAGYVQWPESGERSSIAREAKRARDGGRAGDGDGEIEMGMGMGRRGCKRVRVEY
jgi:hypothetical protein